MFVEHSTTRADRLECPDCGVPAISFGGQHVATVHHNTCPLALGQPHTNRDDTAWFREHPDTTERVRPMTRAEENAFTAASGERVRFRAGWRTHITRHNGITTAQFIRPDGTLAATVTTLSESAA